MNIGLDFAIAAFGSVFGLAFGALLVSTLRNQRLWAGIFRGWKTREEAPVEYAFAVGVYFVAATISWTIAIYGFWLMTR